MKPKTPAAILKANKLVVDAKAKLGLTTTHCVNVSYWYRDHTTPPSYDVEWRVTIFKSQGQCEIGTGPTPELALESCVKRITQYQDMMKPRL